MLINAFRRSGAAVGRAIMASTVLAWVWATPAVAQSDTCAAATAICLRTSAVTRFATSTWSRACVVAAHRAAASTGMLRSAETAVWLRG